MDGSIAPRLRTAEPLAILAGGGTVPIIVAAAAARAGRPVIVIGIEGEADREIEAFAHQWVKWHEIGRLLRTLRQHEAQDLVLVGPAVVMLTLLLPIAGTVGDSLARAADWALQVPIGAVFRGILIGVGVLVAVFAARTLLGIGPADE